MSAPDYTVKILGIDPGSTVAGFACLGSMKSVPIKASDFRVIDAGALRFNTKLSHANRIGDLHHAVYELIDQHQPQFCAVEKAFCGVNQSSALKLGEARGSVIAAVHRQRIELRELTPAEVKRCIVGNGSATKEEIAVCLKILLGFDLGTLPHDVSDAVAIALSHGLQLAADPALIKKNKALRQKKSSPKGAQIDY